jgi:hypothetical protein
VSIDLLKMAGVQLDAPLLGGARLEDYVYLADYNAKQASALGSIGSGIKSLAKLPTQALRSPVAHASAYRVSNGLAGAGDIGVGDVAQAALGEIQALRSLPTGPSRVNLTRPANYKKDMAQSVMHPWQRGANRAAETFRAKAQNFSHGASSLLRAPLTSMP